MSDLTPELLALLTVDERKEWAEFLTTIKPGGMDERIARLLRELAEARRETHSQVSAMQKAMSMFEAERDAARREAVAATKLVVTRGLHVIELRAERYEARQQWEKQGAVLECANNRTAKVMAERDATRQSLIASKAEVVSLRACERVHVERQSQLSAERDELRAEVERLGGNADD